MKLRSISRKPLLTGGLVVLVLLALSRSLSGAAAAKPDAGQTEFFEKKIRPVLAGECYECHSAKKQKGGLRLDYRAGLLKGGETGPAIEPGDAKKSLLISAIAHERDDLKMPEKGVKLDATVIKDFIAWVNMGAPDPRDAPPVQAAGAGNSWDATLAARKTWWSFQPVQKPAVPTPKAAAWSGHPVDRFLAAKMEERGLSPVSAADPSVLVRRLYFSLTGLPPKPEEVETFVRDCSTGHRPSAIANLTDRLLASPRFGERWARHWMDLVRYAETHGSEGDPEIREAWRYRDYLIRAFNADVPCNQLIREHIAGDLLPNPRLNRADGLNESVLGIASLRFNEHGFQPVDTLDDQVKTVDNQIDVLSKAFQAQTVSCARCHDHKFDPISQRDFYALYGVLAGTRPAQVVVDAPELQTKNRDALAKLKAEIKLTLADAWLASARELPKKLQPGSDTGEALARRVHELEKQLGKIESVAHERLAGARTARPSEAATSNEHAGKLPAPLPLPIARWSFDGDARDSVGNLHGELFGDANIRNGRLILNGTDAHVRTAPLARDLKEKTLEAWVALADLDQRGGGVVTVESAKGSIFDAIVFAEKAPRKWVNGSNNFRRSKVLDGADETAGPGKLVHVAVVYRADSGIAFYRNGAAYVEAYKPEGSESTIHTFTAGDAHLLFGRRHTGGGRAYFAGEIDEARLYDRALNAEEIAASFRAGPAGVSEAELTRVLTPEERSRRESLTRDLVTARQELATKQQKTSTAGLLAEAARDEANPLHAWAKLGRLNDAEFGGAWAESAAKRRSRALDSNYCAMWNLGGGDDRQWFRSGMNLPAHASGAGEFALEPEGEQVVSGIYAAGVYSHGLSQKHGGLFTSPRFKIETDSISVRALGGGGAMVRLIVDNYPLGINPIFPKATLDKDEPGWIRLDTNYRKGSWAYLEFGTVDDLTRPVAGKKKAEANPGGRSFFGVEGVAFHDSKEPPRETNAVTALLFAGVAPKSAAELAARYGALLKDAVHAWRDGSLSDPQRVLLDFAVRHGFLPNTLEELARVAPLVARYRKLESEIPVPRHAPGVVEALAGDAPLLPRGDHTKPGELVPRGYLQVLGRPAFFQKDDVNSTSGRLQLAEAIASSANPLTARVMVNRLWHHLFGRGLVPTMDNFGRLGDKPTHPELLDYLAARFVEDGWSFKQMIRFLVTSQAWQMSSEPSALAREIDPANDLLSHFRVRRLEAEAIRDSLLAVSGELDTTMFGKGVSIGDQKRRSIYVAIRRNSLSPFLEVFDAPKPFTTLGRRDVTNVPAQSLALLNDPFVIYAAERWAKSLMQSPRETTAEARVRRMFAAAFARPPSAQELEKTRLYLAGLAREHGVAEAQALNSEDLWRDFAQSLFNFKEFIYIR